jgi:putative transposase
MWRLPVMCRVLGVSKAGYFAWRRRDPSPRTQRNRSLTARIAALHAERRGVYGSPRMHRELRNQGLTVGKHRVARLMREAGISARQPKRFVITTDSKHGLPVSPNILKQDFTATAPNTRWVTDITYIPTAEGWLYLDAIMDLYSRRIVGWAMDERMDRSLVMRALDMAVGQRYPAPGLIHHSDRGSQFACSDYRQRLTKHGMTSSMSRRACCYDNAAMESFFHTLKVELIHRHRFQTRQQAKAAIFEYIESFYNRVRTHSALGYLSPAAFEARLVRVA